MKTDTRRKLEARYAAAFASNGIPALAQFWVDGLGDAAVLAESVHWEQQAKLSLPDRCTHPMNLMHTVFPGCGGGERVMRKILGAE